MIISNSITHFKLLLPHRIAEETVTDQMKKKKPKQEKKMFDWKEKGEQTEETLSFEISESIVSLFLDAAHIYMIT